VADVFDGIPGQAAAVASLRAAAVAPVHAYLLVGPPGAGARALASAFSAALLCPSGGDGTCRDCRLALAGAHPDAVTFEPTGASLLLADAEEITRLALRSPVEGSRKVLVLTEFHRVQQVGPALLKTIEEPPASTVFVLLADFVPPELVTIASRCVRIDVPPLPEALVASVLEGEGVEPARAAAVAVAAAGSLDRARLLVTDSGLAARREAWARVPERLDGSGAAVAVVVGELLDVVEAAAAPLAAAQAEEIAALDARVAETGERGSGRKALTDRHRRELRRHRTEELRSGLGALAARYRDALVADPGARGARDLALAVDAITAAAEALTRNPNESLLLQSLLLRLPTLRGAPVAAGTLGGPPE
jgi:DNA polymerase-3 subunit delta'